MSSDARRMAAVLLLVLLPAAAAGQATLVRTPNLSAGWVGYAGQAYFHFLHRFQRTPPPARKVSSSPTFLLGYAPLAGLLGGIQYATSSTVAPGYPNEWEAFGRLALLAEERAPFAASLQAGYNEAARSLDLAVDAGRRIGPLRALGTARYFTAGWGGDGALAAGGGVVLALGAVALGGDVVRVLDGSEDAAWGVGVQWRLPHTPHTLSVQASNTGSGTLQGSSRGEAQVRYGFEFTVPVTLARYFGGSGRGGAVTRAGDTVTIRIRNLAYGALEQTVRPGTVVRWVNEDPVEHTVTDVGGRFDSGPIRPGGGVFERRFDAPGEYRYTCTPHPFMKAVITVAAAGRDA